MVHGTIWTIGHSTRSIDEFIELLTIHKIEMVADIRRFPGSRKYPHFNKDVLSGSLSAAGLSYRELPELGGRRRPRTDSKNIAWRNPSFRAYADHMETRIFSQGIEQLLSMAELSRTVLMCSEAVWWRCHRALVADHLKSIGMRVEHILGPGRTQLHPYTSAARISNGSLNYRVNE